MIWPNICVDNFFENPKKILDFSSSLNYKIADDGRWPGKRTDLLHLVNPEFFNWSTKKILSILYPLEINNKNFMWTATQYFQKISSKIYTNTGWIHRDDPDEFTVIIYLSNHKNCGTSLYEPKEFAYCGIHEDFKQKSYLTLNKKLINDTQHLNENNDRFTKIFTFPSKFNRLVLFDSNYFHAADQFIDKDNLTEDRLTLITFFKELKFDGLKYPITEMRRIQ